MSQNRKKRYSTTLKKLLENEKAVLPFLGTFQSEEMDSARRKIEIEALSQYERLFEQLKGYGWAVSGSIDNKIELEYNPEDTNLKARIIVKREDDKTYKTGGGLLSPDGKVILPIRFLGTISHTVAYLEQKILGVLDPYFTGNTNDKIVRGVYNTYKKKPSQPTL